jgi:mono/diheme cytochrome c family protein
MRWEDGGVTSRFCLALLVVAVTLSGCGDVFRDAPVVYKDSERFATDLKEKPKLQEAVRKSLADLFGTAPNRIKVPPDSGFPEGGRRLGNLETSDVKDAAAKVVPISLVSPRTGEAIEIVGGYGLYRKYCLHCHGVQGGGDGATAPFLYPRPRDYRPGTFKFTSTAQGTRKPTRADLARTVRRGLDGTSMPGFEALMNGDEIEQVVDYVIFLSMRGEIEKRLIDEAKTADKDDPELLASDFVAEQAQGVIGMWKEAESLVVNPKSRWTPPSSASVLRGRDLFLGINTTGNKVGCVDCHGLHGHGDGPSFVDKGIFDKVVFRNKPLDRAIDERYRELADERKAAAIRPGETSHGAPTGQTETLDDFKKRTMTAWQTNTLDEWGNPHRPADLARGLYKGGRRPIDLYWRIAKGINGTKMLGHSSLLPDDQIWDMVNFVVALGVEREPVLLKDSEALRRNFAAKPATASAPQPPAPGTPDVASAPHQTAPAP